jgi:hypothetical protein
MSWLRGLWQRFWRWIRPGAAPFTTVLVGDLPDDLRARTIYLVGEDGHLWCAAILCPCGCGDVIQLNLLEAARPSWKVRESSDGTISIEPSVWRQKGCRSHFFVRKGVIEWCQDAGAAWRS